MGLKEDVVTAAVDILKTDSEGMTGEALAREIGRRVGRQFLPKQVTMALQGAPQRFTEGGDGRWRLRAKLDFGHVKPHSRATHTGDRPGRGVFCAGRRRTGMSEKPGVPIMSGGRPRSHH